MADGYRFPQQSAGNYYYPQHTQPHHPRHQIIRNGTPPNNIRSVFSADTPSPSRSPDSHSPAQNLYGMFNQNHQQGQHGRVNGAGGRGMPAMYNFQHQNTHQPQHMQHHANIQQDHPTHTTNGAVLGHHASYSSGVLSNSTPSFTPSNLQNGHSATTRGGQAQQITEHWAEQIRLHKESEKAHSLMMEGAPNHYARLRAGENRGITPAPAQPVAASDDPQDNGESRDLGRMADQQNPLKRQDWHNMDLSGQGLRVLSAPVFNYVFLKELYVASNKLAYLPPTIGQLRHLTLLDVSNNQLVDLPPELGMCVYMKQLLAFDNRIQTLPNELGSLYQLDILGIEGNPIDQGMKQVVIEHGTKKLIERLREEAPGKATAPLLLILANGKQFQCHLRLAQFSTSLQEKLVLRTENDSRFSHSIS
jgi:CCR4-NOT transcription complex subunit 6